MKEGSVMEKKGRDTQRERERESERERERERRLRGSDLFLFDMNLKFSPKLVKYKVK